MVLMLFHAELSFSAVKETVISILIIRSETEVARFERNKRYLSTNISSGILRYTGCFFYLDP